MPFNGARGKPVPKQVVAERARRVEDAYLLVSGSGGCVQDVVRQMLTQFGLRPSTTRRYVAKFLDRLAAAAPKRRVEVDRELVLARLDRHVQGALAEGVGPNGKRTRTAWSAIVAAERLRAQVLGVMAPEKLVLSGAVGVKSLLEGLTSEQLAAFAASGELPDDPHPAGDVPPETPPAAVPPNGSNGSSGPAAPAPN